MVLERSYCSFCGVRLEEGKGTCPNCGVGADDTGGSADEGETGYRASFSPGTEVREYRVIRLMGAGGAGEVYLAEHVLTGQRVAMKALFPHLVSNPAHRQRFINEGRALSQLSHPNIVRILNQFVDGGRIFLVMEFVEGQSLDALLDTSPRLPLERSLTIMRGVLSALNCAHSLAPPLVHRDIKPANIMVRTNGEVVVTDFGIARQQGDVRLTSAGGLVGTPEYMSPEQVRGGEVGPQADIYSCGILFYRMLSGRVPFPYVTDEDFFKVLTAHVNEPVPPLGVEVPASVQIALAKALSKNPGERFDSAGSFLASLPLAVPQTSPRQSSPPPVAAGRASPTGSRTRPGRTTKIAIAAVVMACLLVAVGLSLFPRREPAGAAGQAPMPQTTAPVVLPADAPSVVAPAAAPEGKPPEASTAPQPSPSAATAVPPNSPAAATAGAPQGGSPTDSAPEARSGNPPGDSKLRFDSGESEQRESSRKKNAPASSDKGTKAAANERAQPVEADRPWLAKKKVPGGQYAWTNSEKTEFVTLQPFCIDRTEVTNSQYDECVGAGVCTRQRWQDCVHIEEIGGAKSKQTGLPGRPSWNGSDHPTLCVSLDDATAYCRFKNGGVPTAPQWEAAARGTAGRLYPWGGSAPGSGQANGCDRSCPFSWSGLAGYDDSEAFTSRAGMMGKGASPFDVLDMAGNVWEWAVRPDGKPVVKGGAWNSKNDDLKATTEYRNVVRTTRWNSIGFRCVYPPDACTN